MEYKNLTYSNRNRKNGGSAVCYFHSHMDWNRVSGAEQLLRNWSGGEINPISEPLRYSLKANGDPMQNQDVRWNLLERATGVYEQERGRTSKSRKLATRGLAN